MEPDEMKCVRRIIYVFYLLKCIERIVFVVKLNVDSIVDFLLPILGEGCKLQAKSYKQ